jgi:Cu-Zn family superoxide dismutase
LKLPSRLAAAAAVLAASGVLSGVTADDDSSSDRKKAVAAIQPRSGSNVQGTATFTQKGKTVTLELVVSGLAPGVHAVHLHETGDCSDPEAKSAGAHWNPTHASHGKFSSASHRGDIGNLTAGADGQARLRMSTKLWSIGGPAESDVLKRAVIVHTAADDFVTQPTGNAGGRIGCGIVELAK